jgi:hypothetical protein
MRPPDEPARLSTTSPRQSTRARHPRTATGSTSCPSSRHRTVGNRCPRPWLHASRKDGEQASTIAVTAPAHQRVVDVSEPRRDLALRVWSVRKQGPGRPIRVGNTLLATRLDKPTAGASLPASRATAARAERGRRSVCKVSMADERHLRWRLVSRVLGLPLQVDWQIEKYEASVFNIHHQGRAMVYSVVDVAGNGTCLMALTGVLGGFEVPVSVVPGQEHVVAIQSFPSLGVSQTHRSPVVAKRRFGVELDPRDTGQVRCLRQRAHGRRRARRFLVVDQRGTSADCAGARVDRQLRPC